MSAKKAKPSAAAAFIQETNAAYEKVHVEYENQFWGTKMNLGGSYSTPLLSETKEAMETFLGDASRLATAEGFLASEAEELTSSERTALECFVRTFKCYQMGDPDAIALRAQCTALENTLNDARNKTFKLGYLNPQDGGAFVEGSSVVLRAVMKTSPDEATRKAAWEGLRSIGPFVLGAGLVEMVKLRNSMARKLGYEDYYDYKVTQAEGFSKATLFGILDTLKDGSDALLQSARARLAADKGSAALEAWNTGYLMAGDVETALDPYFPFEKSVEVWGRSFAGMGIKYQGATMTLDLLDRKGKYSNGFCHWPQPAWRKPDGSWQPATTNFTSLANPSAVGSGKVALTTLMHEAGHAAHFANIDMPSPLFSQERAPTSVAYAENQSMFLDSLVSDAAWRAVYAKDRSGAVLPWDLHQKELEATHPYQVFTLRAMLAVPYFEKALYEMPESELSAASIQALADKVELDVQGGLASRPLLSVPHVISDEASCYYHGYVLAEMSVYQTRAHFLRQGPIVDNPKVGATLASSYWQPGNSAKFLDLVANLTGAPLTGAAWIAELEEGLEAKIASEKAEYDAARARVEAAAAANGDNKAAAEVDLNMRVVVKDGDAPIADSEGGSFLQLCATFEEYIGKRFPRTPAV